MRYEIGEEIWTLFAHIRKNMFYPSFSRFVPWRDECHQPIDEGKEIYPRLEFQKLVVKEHHLVPGEWDNASDEKKNDGFVLAAENGHVWHNQYPVAHYGQMNDNCDGLFRLDVNVTHRDIGENLLTYNKIKRHFDTPDFTELYETYDLIRELKHMRRSIEEFKGNTSPIFSDKIETSEKEARMLERWHDHIIAEFEKATGMFISSTPHMYDSHKEPGVMKHLPGWYDYKITATKCVSLVHAAPTQEVTV